MKLGRMLGYSGAEMKLPVELVQRAEALGFDSVWTAKAYGSDATSPLAAPERPVASAAWSPPRPRRSGTASFELDPPSGAGEGPRVLEIEPGKELD